jgi:ribosome-associated heat shock protein Hsp15
MAEEKVRIDKYLWSIRLFKTRSLAAEACDKGRVRLKETDQIVKASKAVKLGEVYQVKTEARDWTIKVLGIIEKRVAYQEAVLHYEDLTPPELKEKPDFQAPSFHTGKRLSKIGRPTKKQRRDIEGFMED